MTVRLCTRALGLVACMFLSTLAIAQPLASIEGTVVGANHLPLAGTEVLLSGFLSSGLPDPENSHSATADTFGKFSFPGLRPGVYEFSAYHVGYVQYNSFLARFKLGAPALTLAAEQHKTDVVLELVPLTVLSGKVTDEDGNPMPGITVRALRFAVAVNGHLRIANAGSGFHTDAQGKYELRVDPGHWYLSFSTERPASDKPEPAPDDPERDYVTTYYPGTRELSVASPISAAAGQQVAELNVRLQKTPVYHVRGKIAGGVDSMRRNLRVITTLEMGDVLAGMTDAGGPVRADGTFDIGGLAPGTWTLILMPSNTRDTFGTRTVNVTDRDVEDVVIAVQPPADLSGSVKIIAATKPGAQPTQANVTSLQVQLDPLDSVNSFDAPLRSDGSFIIRDMESGKYRVDVIPLSGGFVKSVTYGGRECIDSGIDLSGGVGDSRLQIVVSMNTGQITGTVTNPEGARLPEPK